MFNPEEIKKMEASRKESDEKLEAGGAEINENGILELTEEQVREIEKEMDAFLNEKEEKIEQNITNSLFDQSGDFDDILDSALEKIKKLNIPNELKEQWSNSLEESEDEDQLRQGLLNIEDKYTRRNASSKQKFSTQKTEKKTFENSEREESEHEKTLKNLVKEAMEGKYDKAGQGMSAAVFTSKNHPEMCYKIITDSQEYETCVNVKEEMNFLAKLSELNIDGVRVPKAYYYHMSPENHLCIMEKLNAANLQEILEGKHALPEDFDIDKQFNNLRKFFDIMHTQYHIHHRDFHEGNIMFDLDDGTAYVIDFGKSVYSLDSEGDMHTDQMGRTAPLNDDSQLEKRYNQLKQFLTKKQ